jgi:hypothetical protein
MRKLSINLLPPELEENKKKARKRAFVFRISVGILALMIILSISGLVLDIVQGLALQNEKKRVDVVKAQVSNYKDQEGLLLILKDRLGVISSLLNVDTPHAKAFTLITTLTPANVVIQTFSIDKKGAILLGGEADNPQSLQRLFDNLTSPKVNENKITNVKLDSLNVSDDASIRFNLVLTLSSQLLADTVKK